MPSIDEREKLIALRFSAWLGSTGLRAPDAARKFQTPERDFDRFRVASLAVPFRTVFLAWREDGLNPHFIATGKGDPHFKMRGFNWLQWEDEDLMARPFSEVYDSHLANLFAAPEAAAECRLALFEAVDRAKAALARGEMSEEQESALREAVAPWSEFDTHNLEAAR